MYDAIQEALDKANEEAVSNAAKVCNKEVLHGSFQSLFITCGNYAGEEVLSPPSRLFHTRRRTRFDQMAYTCHVAHSHHLVTRTNPEAEVVLCDQQVRTRDRRFVYSRAEYTS